jgi:hypothetical protein
MRLSAPGALRHRWLAGKGVGSAVGSVLDRATGLTSAAGAIVADPWFQEAMSKTGALPPPPCRV